MAEMNSASQLIQFLMGLEESYDNVRSQILLMDPLPTIGKAYSMLLRIEKQREVHVGTSQDGAMTARFSNNGKQAVNITGQKRRGQMDKKSQYCDHCRRNGHTRESCFQLTYFPKWYRVLMDQRRNAGGPTNRAYLADTEEGSQGPASIIGTDLSDLIRTEIRRAMQEHNHTQEHDTNLVDFNEFAGNIFTFPHKNMTTETTWIIDSGASTHMCSIFSMLDNVRYLNQPVFVKLPDGTKKEVTHKGDIQLTKNIKLKEVLYIPSFRHNLLLEPSTFTEAKQNDEWKKAMQSEVEALKRNGTWELVQAPTDKKTIGCRWIYKLKLKPDGTVERYKARLVAKGYSQIEGEDYTDSFAPVAKAVTVRLFLAIAVSKGWPIHHLNVNNAFLHGSLKENIYMDPPEGNEVKLVMFAS
ncbi:UNVERIFIED_CONTAM: Retrovirus-related Pol polyprotein from transposon RE2 [Sesamum latifolium]|uniref:Retrovirus-related Pol polyprotein from transposon RE2 n=1 Tax=Sesamum latifolium TaxID=2727402 RepID=A0AAW2TFJ0_9LAMI